MEPITLIAILLGGVSIAALIDGSDDSSDTTQDSFDEGADDQTDATDGDDVIIAAGDDTADWRAEFETPGRINTLHGTAGQGTYPDHGLNAYESPLDEVPVPLGVTVDRLAGLTEVSPGAGNDTITLSGEDVLLFPGGEGADTIDASALGSGIVLADPGSHVTGSDVVSPDDSSAPLIDRLPPDVSYPAGSVIFMGEDMTFAGGEASEYVFAMGDASSIDGAGGNDVLVAEGAATLSGGAGDDFLSGNYREANYYTQYDVVGSHSNGEANMLDGGDGNDTIHFDSWDTVTGGAGEDSLVGYISDEAGTSVVTDFDPTEDSLTLWVGGDPTELTITEENGDTLITRDGDVLARIEGQTGLIIGYNIIDEDNDYSYLLTDMMGNPISADDVDLVLTEHLDTLT